MKVVFTDLDGTLLDSEDYSFRAALPALKHLKRNNVPWIMVTSKTRAEVEHWRTVLGNDHPFIVENGGAAFVPSGYFPIEVASTTRDGYTILEWGMKYERLIAALVPSTASTTAPMDDAREMGAKVREFSANRERVLVGLMSEGRQGPERQ